MMRSSFDRQAYAHTIAHLKRLGKYSGRPDAELAERWKTNTHGGQPCSTS